jgi:ferredoxin
MVINVCKLKTHAGLRLSGAIKNIFGILPGGYKQRIHMWTKNDFELSDVFIDLINLVKPSLHIMDAVVALDGGPSAIGRPVTLKMILASKNPAALDIVAARMIGYEPTDISTLIRAQERGMIDDFNDIAIRLGQQSVKADDDDFPLLRFKKLIRGPLEMSRGKAGLFVTDTFVEPVIRRSKCSRCGECIHFCSPGAISTDDGLFPLIDREKCINCYCCISACSEDAIGIRSSFKNKVIRVGRFLLRI